jgi:hypothetical protein
MGFDESREFRRLAEQDLSLGSGLHDRGHRGTHIGGRADRRQAERYRAVLARREDAF